MLSLPYVLATCSSILLFGACFYGYRRQLFASQPNVISRLQLEQTPQFLQAPGPEARFMLRETKDVSKTESIFTITDCNQVARKWFNGSSNVGDELQNIFPTFDTREIKNILATTSKIGFCDFDVSEKQATSAEITWLNFSGMKISGSIFLKIRDITEVKNQELKLEKLAFTDALTSLPNRHWLIQNLPSRINRAKSERSLVGLIFIDLDDFKIVNDSFGHQVGDEYLMSVATAIQDAIRTPDIAIRLAGDEFTVIVNSPCDRTILQKIGTRIIDHISKIDCQASRCGFQPRASLGMAIFPEHGENADSLICSSSDLI
jgi:diguanylate cyclase (GGDEF)-like protein